MDDNGRNGLYGLNGDELEDDIITEDDIIEVIDVGPNDHQEDMANDLEMLDVEEDEQDEDAIAMATGPYRDDATGVFSKHTGSVFCVDLTQSGQQLAVTGGEDDTAYVWNISTGEILFQCTGHKDSVTCVGFSTDSVFVATGDLSGLVQVWNIQHQKVIWSFEVSDLEWLTWHTSAPILLAGTVDGDIWMWKVPGGDTKTFQSFGCACNIGEVMPDGKRAVVGYNDGSVRVWDLKAASTTQTFQGRQGHRSAITSISCHSDSTNAITGSTDCTALLFNTVTGKMLGRFQCKTSSSIQEDSVESVGLSNVLNCAATGTLSGSLAIWDIPTQVCRQHCKHEAGVVKLCWHESEPLIYTCSLDGAVQLYDARNGKLERQWVGHQAPILDLQVAKSGGVLVSTSDDHTARVYTLS